MHFLVCLSVLKCVHYLLGSAFLLVHGRSTYILISCFILHRVLALQSIPTFVSFLAEGKRGRAGFTWVGSWLAGVCSCVCVCVWVHIHICTRKAQSKSITMFAPFAVRDCAAGHGYIYVFEGVRLSRAIDVLRCYYVYIARGMRRGS